METFRRGLVFMFVVTFMRPSLGDWNPTLINVLDCGAVGDGKTNDTDAFLAAFKKCENLDAAIVYVPDGTYLLWPIQLPRCKNSILHIHGVILGPTSPEEWYLDALIDVRGAYNFTIQGDFKGMIDGRGHEWWDLERRQRTSTKTINDGPVPSAPSLLRFSHFEEDTPGEYGEPPSVYNISLQSAPGAHALVEATLMYSYLTLNGVIVQSPPNVTTTAGFVAVNASLSVYRCTIDTGGHNVLLYSPAGQNNRIYAGVSESEIGYGEGITLVMQDGLAGNLSMYDNQFHETKYGYRILTPQGGTGTISGFFVYNSNMTDVGTPIAIDMFYCPQGGCKNQTAGRPDIPYTLFILHFRVNRRRTRPFCCFSDSKTASFSLCLTTPCVSTLRVLRWETDFKVLTF